MKFTLHSTCVDTYACKGKELKAQISSVEIKVSADEIKANIAPIRLSSAQKPFVQNAKHPPIYHPPRTAVLPQ
jgi:hypothetical protein